MDLTRNHFIRLCAGGLAAAVLPACGGNNGKPDANPGPGIDAPKPVDAAFDARLIDAPTDAAIDAPIDPPIDAAIDAAPVDAPIDAPAVDAPIDAPAVDAPIDAPPIDAPPIDAPIDAPPIDAPPIDAPPIDAPPMSGCTQTGTKITIAANHGHTLTVTKADVISGVAKTYNIAGTGGHSHFVTVTAAMFVLLQNGTPISLNSTSNGHIHGVSISCL